MVILGSGQFWMGPDQAGLCHLVVYRDVRHMGTCSRGDSVVNRQHSGCADVCQRSGCDDPSWVRI